MRTHIPRAAAPPRWARPRLSPASFDPIDGPYSKPRLPSKRSCLIVLLLALLAGQWLFGGQPTEAQAAAAISADLSDAQALALTTALERR